MALEVEAIRSKLAMLGDRNWPEEWGNHEAETIGDFYGWCHRYKLEDPLPASEVDAFERNHGVTLPDDYRQFLIELGNGGAGPDYGIYRLAEGEDDWLPQEILGSIGREFALTEAWNDTSLLDTPERYYGYELMAGALTIGTQGCARDYWMVVSGAGAGQIWLDKRTDNEGVEPVTNTDGKIMTFGEWYNAWLDERSSSQTSIH